MIGQEESYFAQVEYSEYQRVINTVEVLNQEQYEMCVAWDAEEAASVLNYLGNGRWLNINVYSEADHHDQVLRMEQGI